MGFDRWMLNFPFQVNYLKIFLPKKKIIKIKKNYPKILHTRRLHLVDDGVRVSRDTNITSRKAGGSNPSEVRTNQRRCVYTVGIPLPLCAARDRESERER